MSRAGGSLLLKSQTMLNAISVRTRDLDFEFVKINKNRQMRGSPEVCVCACVARTTNRKVHDGPDEISRIFAKSDVAF